MKKVGIQKFSQQNKFTIPVFEDLLIYLEDRVIGREGEIESEILSGICCSFPDGCNSWDWTRQSQEPRTALRVSLWVSVALVLWLLSALFPGTLLGSWIRSEAVRL